MKNQKGNNEILLLSFPYRPQKSRLNRNPKKISKRTQRTPQHSRYFLRMARACHAPYSNNSIQAVHVFPIQWSKQPLATDIVTPFLHINPHLHTATLSYPSLKTLIFLWVSLFFNPRISPTPISSLFHTICVFSSLQLCFSKLLQPPLTSSLAGRTWVLCFPLFHLHLRPSFRIRPLF